MYQYSIFSGAEDFSFQNASNGLSLVWAKTASEEDCDRQPDDGRWASLDACVCLNETFKTSLFQNGGKTQTWSGKAWVTSNEEHFTPTEEPAKPLLK